MGERFKVVVSGNSGAGKTSLLLRFTDNTFSESKSVTLPVEGEEYRTKEIKNVKKGKDVTLQVYDTAGQEKFRTITSSYYRGAVGAMLVYDITDPTSFSALKGWLDDLNHYLPEIPRIIVANKTDLDEQVDSAEAEKFAKEAKAEFHSTSAKTGEGVDAAFLALAKLVVAAEEQKAAAESGTVDLPVVDSNVKKRRCALF